LLNINKEGDYKERALLFKAGAKGAVGKVLERDIIREDLSLG
jgi:hypothetical protein